MASINELQAKRIAERTAIDNQKKEDHIENLTIRQQLEQKLKTDIITVPIPSIDENGIPITIKLRFRKLNTNEHDFLMKAQRNVGTAGKDLKKAEDEADKIFELLGKKSLDDLNKEFWKTGDGYSGDVFFMILMELLKASVYPDEEYMNRIKKFQ
jgi:hypothetical protein